MFRREVPVRSTSGAHLGVTLFGLVMVIGMAMPGRRRPIMCDFDRGGHEAPREYADTGYIFWRRDHPKRRCPETLAELTEYTRSRDFTDRWGYDLRMTCDDRGLRVWSLGPDHQNGTADDAKSWE